MTKLNINGYAQHGKDTVAKLFTEVDPKITTVNTSHLIAQKMFLEGFPHPYKDWKECYEDRVNHRDEWFEYISRKRLKDVLWVTKDVLEQGDIYTGHRSIREFVAGRPLVDATIWVDASGRGLEKEPMSSCQIGPSMHNFVIDNSRELWMTRKQVEYILQLLNQKERAINAYS